jgi:glucokinase
MILAGDIGGTKTLLGIFDAAPVRPRAAFVRSYGTLDYDDLSVMIAEFLRDGETRPGAIDRACFASRGR